MATSFVVGLPRTEKCDPVSGTNQQGGPCPAVAVLRSWAEKVASPSVVTVSLNHAQPH